MNLRPRTKRAAFQIKHLGANDDARFSLARSRLGAVAARVQRASRRTLGCGADVRGRGDRSRIVRFGTWGVDLATRDLNGQAGRRFRSAMPAATGWTRPRSPPTSRRTASARSSTTATRSSCARSSPARPKDSQLGALLRQLHGRSAARAARRGAAEGRPRPRSTRSRPRPSSRASWRRRFADFGSTLFGAGVLPDPANPAMNIAVRRHVRHGPAGPRLLPARQVQAAARRLSRLHRAHARR